MLKTLKFANFKSFANVAVQFGDFNMLIGANASGKSNFIQVFRFLRDILNHGLANAISMQGGVEYLRNIAIASDQDLSIEFGLEGDMNGPILRLPSPSPKTPHIALRTLALSYSFSLRFRKKGAGFNIGEDRLTLKTELFERPGAESTKHAQVIARGEIVVSRVSDRSKINLSFPQEALKYEDSIRRFFSARYLIDERLPARVLLAQELPPFFFHVGRVSRHSIFDVSIYDFDPKLPKRAVPITGKAELEEDGSNLAIVIKNIIETRESRRKFGNLVKDLLPFVENLEVEKFADKSLLFKLREKYFPKHFIPASLISDGTINMTALIVALYFTPAPLTIIEEPERNIHPHLLSRVVSMMKDAAKAKQIIATTQNPEVVKHTGMSDLILISRDNNGFSAVCRPSESSEVCKFLLSEMGIEELYVKNLLNV